MEASLDYSISMSGDLNDLISKHQLQQLQQPTSNTPTPTSDTPTSTSSSKNANNAKPKQPNPFLSPGPSGRKLNMNNDDSPMIDSPSVQLPHNTPTSLSKSPTSTGTPKHLAIVTSSGSGSSSPPSSKRSPPPQMTTLTSATSTGSNASNLLRMAANDIELNEDTNNRSKSNLLTAALTVEKEVERSKSKSPTHASRQRGDSNFGAGFDEFEGGSSSPKNRSKTKRTLLAASKSVDEDDDDLLFSASASASASGRGRNGKENEDGKLSFSELLKQAGKPKRATSPQHQRPNNRNNNNNNNTNMRKSKDSNIATMMRKSTDWEGVKLSKSQQVVFSMTKVMGGPLQSNNNNNNNNNNKSKSRPSSARSRSSTSSLNNNSSKSKNSKEHKTETDWNRLSAPTGGSFQTRQKHEAESGLGQFSDIRNCTFKPKCRKVNSGEQKEDEHDENSTPSEEHLKKLSAFVRRQDAWTRSVRKDRTDAINKKNYEVRLDRLQCRNCGTYQSYDEHLEKRTKCPADMCENPARFYMVQEVFNRDVKKGLVKTIEKVYKDRGRGEVDKRGAKEVESRMRGLEPSEKCVLERLMRELSEESMTEEQKVEREETNKFEKKKRMDEEKLKIETREKLIRMAISERDLVFHQISELHSSKQSVSLRKMYDKTLGKVITVEFQFEQPINKHLNVTTDITDPVTGDIVTIDTIDKVPYYEDGLKRYWNGPQSLLDEGLASFTREEFFDRLAEDSSKRESKAKRAEDSNLGKFSTISKAKNTKNQLVRELEVNDRLTDAIESRELMQLRRAIHEAGTLSFTFNSKELKEAVKLEREVCSEIRLLKEGKTAVEKEDMDGVNDWLKKIKLRRRKKLEEVKFKVWRLEKTEKHISDNMSDDPKYDVWMEELAVRRENLEREKDAINSNEERNEEVAEMKDKLESDRDVLDRLKEAMRNKNLDLVTDALDDAIELGLHLQNKEVNGRKREYLPFFERLEKDVAKRTDSIWFAATVIKVYNVYGKDDVVYDIEFKDGTITKGVKRIVKFVNGRVVDRSLKRFHGGDGDDDEQNDDEEEEEENEEDGSDDENMAQYNKPKTPVYSINTKILARKTTGPGLDTPGPTSYTPFSPTDIRCGPTTVRKLTKRMKAIKGYLDLHPRDKKSPLLGLMYAYAKEKRELEGRMERANVFKDRDEAKDADSDDEEGEGGGEGSGD